VVKKYADPSRVTADLSVSRVSIALSLIAITAMPKARHVVIKAFLFIPFRVTVPLNNILLEMP
jgi:hypothetical protein